MREPVFFLRVASALTFIHALLHTAGGVFGKASPGLQQETMSLMRTNQFQILTTTRTYWQLYLGFGLAISIFLLAEAIIFWQLGQMSKTDASRLRPLLLTFLMAYLALAVNSAVFFFAPPVIIEVLIALCLGLAIRRCRPVVQL